MPYYTQSNLPPPPPPVYVKAKIRHSSKIYDFFGIAPPTGSRNSPPTTTTTTSGTSQSSQSRMLPIQRLEQQQTSSATARRDTVASVIECPDGVRGRDGVVAGRPSSRAASCSSAMGFTGAGEMNVNMNMNVNVNGSADGNGYVEEGTQTQEKGRSPSPRGGGAESNWARRVKIGKRFVMRLVRSSNPIWFSIPTSLAFLALTLRLLPSALAITFPGLVFISTVLFLISLVGFALTSVLFLARLLSPPHIRLRHRSLPLIERDSVELGFVQYWPAGFALSAVAFGSCAVAEGRVANARAWAIAVYACWWITAAWMAGTGFFILAVYMSHSPVLVRSKTSPGRALPLIAVLSGVTGGATVALVGGVMCLPGSGAAPAGFETGTGKIISDAMAAPVVMFSYCSLGALLLLAVMTYAVAMHELLLVTGWPPPELTSVMFHLVGPLGQCSAALLVLGEASGTGRFLGDLDPVQRKLKKISPSTAAALPGAPINVVSAFCGMLLFGTAVLWFVLALIALCYRMYRRELEWSSTWNGAVFPLGTLAISSLWLSFELQSAFFRILTCILLIICLVAFLVVSVFNARSAVRSRVFRP